MVTGVFKFKNVGDEVLKVAPPKPSCGCTIAGLKPDTLSPGESGELAFTLNLGHSRTLMEKHISVTSNDPQSPLVSLIIKADYVPLFEITPLTLAPNLPHGVSVTNQFATVTRTDGKPLHIVRLETSKPWITAVMEPGGEANGATARMRVEIRRDGPPRRFNEFIHVYSAGQTNSPVSTVFVYGHVMGEVSMSPEVLYWSVTDPVKIKAERPEAVVTRRLTIRSANGKAFAITNARSTLKGIKLELVPKEAGQAYELVARLDEVPDQTISGNVSFDTSVAAQSRIEVPVIVNVFKP